MLGFGRPYNNLSVPGFTVGAVNALTGASAEPGLSPLILRGLGTEVQQAIAQHPTFIAIWIGGNDFLGAVSNGKPSLLTSTAAFTAAYNKMLDDLTTGAPNAGMVVGTLPANFAAAPLTARIPGILLNPATSQPVIIGGAPVPLIAELGDGTVGPLPPGSIVLLSALPDLQLGVGIPPALKTIPPFNLLPRVGEPLKDTQTITPAEQAAFNTRIAEFNAAITASATAHNVPVADIKGLFDRFAASANPASPIVIGPFAFSNAFITGGIFSNDGVHLSDLGYILFANEYIKAINAGYGVHIPLASITQVFQNNDPDTHDALGLSFGPEVGAQMISIFHSTEKPAPASRRRSVH
jgi:lysophospholipase L1-like esterase